MLHWGQLFAANNQDLTHATKNLRSGTFANEFHLFSFQWDEPFVDSQKILHADTGQVDFGNLVSTMPGPMEQKWHFLIRISI